MPKRPTTSEHEELFDAFRQVVSQRMLLASAGDDLWNELKNCRSHWQDFPGAPLIEEYIERWEHLRGIGGEPPMDDFTEWVSPEGL